MRIMDERAGEILVTRDPARLCVELQITGAAADGPRVVRLSLQEARRLAALLLFQSARLERPRAGWAAPHFATERKSA